MTTERLSAVLTVVLLLAGCASGSQKCPKAAVTVPISSSAHDGSLEVRLRLEFDGVPDESGSGKFKLDERYLDIEVLFDTYQRSLGLRHVCSRRPTQIRLEVLQAGEVVSVKELDVARDFSLGEYGDLRAKSRIRVP